MKMATKDPRRERNNGKNGNDSRKNTAVVAAKI
jgi:hypothetical protein